MDKYSYLYASIDVRFHVFMQLVVMHLVMLLLIIYIVLMPPPHPTIPFYGWFIKKIFLYELIIMMDRGDFYSTHLSHNLGAQGAL